MCTMTDTVPLGPTSVSTEVDMNCGIYGLFNAVNGKWYVGQSSAMPRRIRSHLTMLGFGKHVNAHLQASFNKYGARAFQPCVLEVLPGDDRAMMNARECWWIAYYRSADAGYGYNLDGGGVAGKVRSPETSAKIAAALRGRKGRKHSKETLAKMSAVQKGHPVSDETRAKISEVLTGRKLGPFTPEHCAKIAAATKGREINALTRARVAEANKRRVFTPEMRKKMSESAKSRRDIFGRFTRDGVGDRQLVQQKGS